MNISRAIFFTVAALGISFVAKSAIDAYSLKKEDDKRKTEQDKFVESMREKYKNINSFDDFNEGIKYVEYPVIAGYDLRLLKKLRPNTLDLITLDELKFIYESSKIGSAKMTDKENNNFYDVMHKMF
jgi:hypothetical protein